MTMPMFDIGGGATRDSLVLRPQTNSRLPRCSGVNWRLILPMALSWRVFGMLSLYWV